jgi:hypothetical protein
MNINKLLSDGRQFTELNRVRFHNTIYHTDTIPNGDISSERMAGLAFRARKMLINPTIFTATTIDISQPKNGRPRIEQDVETLQTTPYLNLSIIDKSELRG